MKEKVESNEDVVLQPVLSEEQANEIDKIIADYVPAWEEIGAKSKDAGNLLLEAHKESANRKDLLGAVSCYRTAGNQLKMCADLRLKRWR